MDCIEINDQLLAALHLQAAASERKRMNYDLRTTAEDGSQRMLSKCPKFGVIANLEVESVVNTFAVIIHLKLSHYGNDRLRKRV